MLVPKKKIIIHTDAAVVVFRRKDKRNVHLVTKRSLNRLYRTLNEVINQLYGPRVELEENMITVEW